MMGQSETSDRSNGQPFSKPGEEVVISGIAGRFPDSDNVALFQENLFKKADLITADDRRWKSDHPEIPQRSGKINNPDKFDAEFFKFESQEAHMMEPMGRMLLEHTFEAIIDAGVNPAHLRGSNTGVFVGSCYSESERGWGSLIPQDNHWKGSKIVEDIGLRALGCCRALLANRISNYLGVTGPSYTVDTACSSSLFALDHAYRAIKAGECESAIIGGCHMCLHPHLTLQFFRLGVLSQDGHCRSFDADGNGYCRSEAVAVVFLQKSKDAKRVYAQVIHTKTNCDGFKVEGITFPSGNVQTTLLENFYEECKIPPSSLAFVEAHGTGTKVGDPVEVKTLEQIFCPGRTTPLRIGSIKSNIGHTEPASGLCAITKVVIAMETGYIPPNLHYKRPREGMTALEDGRIEVVTEVTPLEGGLVGVNSFGFGGANAHVLLRSNPKDKVSGGAPSDDLPRLVTVSGRTENAVETLLDHLETRPVDAEFVSLLHEIHAQEITDHFYRGYTILPPRGLPEDKIRDVRYCSGAKRPVWFVFSGMGSQWVGMGEGLMEIPAFVKAVEKCDAALKPYGINILDILTKKDAEILNNVVNSCVGIVAVQIGLVDVLASLGIVPDNIIGHSIGELGAAYAEGCLTLDQTILSAYFQALALTESKTSPGSMATVLLGWEELKKLCPRNIEIAFHDAPGSSTVAGPAEAVKKFVVKLQAMNILASEQPCDGIAYHSGQIAAAGVRLLNYLRKIIPSGKPRGKKWLSTSVPREKWDSSLGRFCSAEYLVQNLLSPVLFEEISRQIPKNAITVEIAPHALLKTVLRKSVNENVVNVALANRESGNNFVVLLKALAKIFENGLNLKLTSLYPEIKYPVSRGTPMISPLIRWDHSDDWFVVSFKKLDKIDSGERYEDINLSDEHDEWMAGHVIDGRNLLPATGYLTSIWQTVGMMRGDLFTETSVIFEDVRFHRATTIPAQNSIKLGLMVQKGTGRFEIFEGGASVVTGFIRVSTNPGSERTSAEIPDDEEDELVLTSKDIYKEFRLRGYHYSGMFRGLKRVSMKGTRGVIAWESNWGVFMDNMLQIAMIGKDTRGLFVPTGIRKLVIDAKLHSNQLRAMQNERKDLEFAVRVDNDLGTVVSGGIEIQGLKVNAIGRKKPSGDPVLEKFVFVDHRDGAVTELRVAIRIATQIAIENHFGVKIKSLELIDDGHDISAEDLTSRLILEYLSDLPLLQADVNLLAPANSFPEDALPPAINIFETKKLTAETDALLITTHGLLANKNTDLLNKIKGSMKDGGFLLARDPLDVETDAVSIVQGEGFDVIMEKRTGKESVTLFRKRETLPAISAVIKVTNNEFGWVSTLQTYLKAVSEKKERKKGRVLLVSEGDLDSGLMGLVNCLRREPGGQVVQGLLILDLNAPKFSLEDPLYSNQLELGLTLNVLRPGSSWGSYRFFAMDEIAPRPVLHTQIIQMTRGDLSTLKWIEGPLSPKRSDVVRVHYSSLNFRDVMISTGKLAAEVVAESRKNQEIVIGFEYSGRDASGRGIMGMVSSGALSNLCVPSGDFLWPVPNNWTLEDAATVPVAYGTAYWALFMSGKMKKGDKVLIHAGSGGVGQAAITLALHEGCEVFTTVGTSQKREFVKNQFPEIDDDHIGNSRDTSFEQLVLHMTKGRGVDIVLNSLAEEKLQASIRCLAIGGRFLEIGKFDLSANSLIGLDPFLKGISFHGIHLDHLLSSNSENKKILLQMVRKGVLSGAVKPLVRTVFTMEQTEAAFRYMAAGKHIGKVLIKIRDEDEEEKGPESRLPLAIPRYHCSGNHSYIILGGLGGFGLELADWLVLRGAQKLVLTSRKGISNGYQRMRINVWKSYGTEVVVVVGEDASTPQGCEAILNAAIALGPVDGIFNLAVVLKDALYENQTSETFEESFRVKAWATKQLDKMSRRMCPQLRHFVVFSSVSCGRGNAGQTNYGMANSVMERICERRAAEDLPGLAVQWGAVGDVGLVAEMLEDHKEVVIGGTLQQRITSCLQELDRFLLQDSPVVSSMVVAEKSAGGSGATNIVDAVLNIMDIKDLKTVSLHTPLSELGMDSMMAVEIKQTLEREFEVFLTAQDIRGLNFAKLQEMSLKEADEDDGRGLPEATVETEDFNGMRLLIRNVGMDHFNKDICVPLSISSEKNGNGEVFIIPGMEGCFTVFESLAGKLKSPTTCLQLGTTFVHPASVEEMADYLIPHVKARNGDRRDFVIAAYSWGTLPAIEIARRLEADGLDGRLVFIDGSPDHMKALIYEQLETDSDDEMQLMLLIGVMDLVERSICADLAVKLQNCKTWEERLDAFTKAVPEHKTLNFTPEDQRAMCSSTYYRMKAIAKYNPSTSSPLRAAITLIKPKIPSVRSISEDYSLRSYTTGNVEIRYAEGNHYTILDDDICAAAIDGELVQDVVV